MFNKCVSHCKKQVLNYVYGKSRVTAAVVTLPPALFRAVDVIYHFLPPSSRKMKNIHRNFEVSKTSTL